MKDTATEVRKLRNKRIAVLGVFAGRRRTCRQRRRYSGEILLISGILGILLMLWDGI